MSTATVMEYDPFSLAFQQDPFPVYRWLRDEAPVYHSEKWGWYALSRYADVRKALRDWKTFSSADGMNIDDCATDQSGPGFLPDFDPPYHTALRHVVRPYFHPDRIAAFEPTARRIVRELVGRWRDGQVDIAQELAWPLPNEVFFDFLGLPGAEEEGRDELLQWTHELRDREPEGPALTEVSHRATAAIQDYFLELVEDRRRTPRDDMVTELVHAEVDGRPLVDGELDRDAEIVGLLMVLFLGGVETTAGLIGNLFKLLGENPDQRRLVQDDPALIPDAVEETLRMAASLPLTARTATTDVTLHDVTIPAGSRVVLVLGAANLDERQFPDPERFDVTRGPRHLAFGFGIHACVGAPLARMEAKVAAQEVLPILGDYQVTGPLQRYRLTPDTFDGPPNSYAWQHVPVSFIPRG